MKKICLTALLALAACDEGYYVDWCSCISQIGLCDADDKCEVITDDGHELIVQTPMLGAEICGSDWIE